MNTNSRAYKDAWKRIRDAIAAELLLREVTVSDAVLDDLACEAAYAAFGLGDDSE